MPQNVQGDPAVPCTSMRAKSPTLVSRAMTFTSTVFCAAIALKFVVPGSTSKGTTVVLLAEVPDSCRVAPPPVVWTVRATRAPLLVLQLAATVMPFATVVRGEPVIPIPRVVEKVDAPGPRGP